MKPTLTFSPPAWAKIQFLLHHHETTEVAFLLVNRPGEPLYIDDVYVPVQEVTAVTFRLADRALSEFAQDMDDRFPEGGVVMSGNLQGHTHPGDSATPSVTDERDFDTSFGRGWAVMFIIARGGQTYARLRTKDPAVVDTALDVRVDWQGWAAAPAVIDVPTWWAQYEGRVRTKRAPDPKNAGSTWFMGHQFSAKEWEEFQSQDWTPRREREREGRGRRDRSRSHASPWLGLEVLYESGRDHGTGRVVEVDEEIGWLTVRDDVSGELVEVEETDCQLLSDANPYGVPSEDDMLARAEARTDECEYDGMWCP